MKSLSIVVLLMLLVLQALACAQSVVERESILQAVTKTSEATSYRQSMTSISTNHETITSSTESEWGGKDYYHHKTIENGAQYEVISIEDMTYYRGFDGSQQWKMYEHGSINEDDGTIWSIVPIGLETELEPLKFVVEIQVLADEDIGGVSCSHYSASVDVNAMVDSWIERAKDSDTYSPQDESWDGMRQSDIDVELWVDRHDYIRQWKIDSRYPESGSWRATIQFFDFNEPISVEPPEIKQVGRWEESWRQAIL
jgi:hypothetical protein